MKTSRNLQSGKHTNQQLKLKDAIPETKLNEEGKEEILKKLK